MTRKQYLAAQKQQGRRLMGVFPAQYPREVLWALGVLPVEIWDPPAPGSEASAHLQPYICSVARQGLQLVLTGGADAVEAFLFPHTCDSIQNLASLIHDFLPLGFPCYFFYHPKEPYSGQARRYYQEQLQELADELTAQFGTLDDAKLAWAVDQGQELAAQVTRLYELRAAGNLAASNRQFYDLIRRGEYLWPTDWSAELAAALDDWPGPPPGSGPRLVISGVLPSPPAVLDLLDRMGAMVAADDLLSASRRLLSPPAGPGDPFSRLTESYFGLPPCSSKNSSLDRRRDWLLKLVEQSKADGVVFWQVKFCETEIFDVPPLAAALKEQGIPVLVMESELGQEASGQLATRLEAFAEMVA